MIDLFGSIPENETPRHAGMWHYVRVAVERGIDQEGSGTGLTYKSPTPVEIGRRVEVPLGRGNAASSGIVIASGGEELLDGFAASRVKAILRDTGTGLTPSLVELAKWIAGYYVCPLGMVLGAMLPAAVKKRTGARTITVLDRATSDVADRVLAEGSETPITPQARKAWEAIGAIVADRWPMNPDALAAAIQSRTLGPINKLVRAGLLIEIDAEDIRATGGVPTQMGIEQADPTGGASFDVARPDLTSQQAVVVEGIAGSLSRFGVHLVRGVTGSGKTEVYLRVLERVLAMGQNAIVLVPEISLTPQTAGRFIERFRAAGVAVLHSGLSASQRNKEWSRVAGGAARVVVGARSAIFAPMENLGLIVVDEEHASDYKQDQLPRYHGRDVAIKRAHLAGCPVILGSATPSLESWVNAQPPARAETEATKPGAAAASVAKYTLWELTERIGAARMPKVHIVDLAEERRIRRQLTGKNDAHLHLLGPTLERAIGETLREGGQTLLLINRRGYSAYIACPSASCGWVMSCDDCDARMVQHRIIAGQTTRKGVVRCHHCLAQKLLPEKCPVCDARTIALGLGTQRVEEELAKKFRVQLGGSPAGDADEQPSHSPHSSHSTFVHDLPGLARVDGDSMGSAKDYFETLSRFAKGHIKILLGTQMIAKGLDFPNVRLVGVINADTALSLPDFRASERTFQLVSQVAGRAGRGSIAGRVFVQTMDPTAEAIVKAAAHDFPGFARVEMRTRHAAGLPPITRMARIVLRDQSLAKAESHAAEIAGELNKALERHVASNPAAARTQIVGPMPCPISRIAAFHRLAIEITSPQRLLIQTLLGELRGRGLLVSDSRTAIDIDPIALM